MIIYRFDECPKCGEVKKIRAHKFESMCRKCNRVMAYDCHVCGQPILLKGHPLNKNKKFCAECTFTPEQEKMLAELGI